MELEPPAGRVYDAYLHLLDRQIVDADGALLCKVDDLELIRGDDGELWVFDILTGPAALGPRLGWIGRRLAAVHRRLTCAAGPGRIPFGVVREVSSCLTIIGRGGELGVQGLEDWLRREVVAPIPGATDAPE
jgi:hypothetical protein